MHLVLLEANNAP